MSFKAAAWAIEQTVTSTPAQKLVLIALADAHNGHTGRCDPSIQRIADMCHMSYRTVTRTLADLEKLGLVQRINRAGENHLKARNHYKLSIGHGVPSIGHPRHPDRTNTTSADGTQCPMNQEVRNQEENLCESTRLPTRFVPDDWHPNPVMERQARPASGIDRDYELRQFRMHEFQQPRTDFDRPWIQWLNRARPRQTVLRGTADQRRADLHQNIRELCGDD